VRTLRLTRRRFLLGTALGALGLGAYTWRVEPHWLSVAERPMPMPGLPPEWEGRTLAQISDLHVSPRVEFDYLVSALQTVNELKPDLVAMTGDFVSAGSRERAEAAARLFEHLNPPPLGCFACLGNHDFGERWSDAGIAEELVRRVTDVGVRVLRNASEVVRGLRVVGVDDMWGPTFSAYGVLSKLKADEPAVVLFHNPDGADLPVWGDFRGWILSGHTHGGQCKPPFLPPPLLPVANKRSTSGEFDLGDGRRMYINRGLGHLLRVRFNVRPEITLHRLTAA
jgi:predicted MPP superfamily phosphohydrolase